MNALFPTFSLFWLMTTLIVVDGVWTEVEPLPRIEIVRVKVDTPVREIAPTQKPVLSAPENAPMLPPTSRTPSGNEDSIGIPEVLETGIRRGDRDLIPELGGRAEGDAIPVVRVAPIFPEQALARGLEGRVLIEFDVSAAGTVENVRVVTYEPSPVFNDAAIKAVRQWRYNPKIVAGKPVAQKGLRIAIPFRREDRVSG